MASEDIDLWGYLFHVGRIATNTVTTQMVKLLFTPWGWAYNELVSNTVGIGNDLTNPKMPIATRQAPFPGPTLTVGSNIDLTPETSRNKWEDFREWFRFHSFSLQNVNAHIITRVGQYN